MSPPPAETPHLPDNTRLETFADGVFAIAITLLVLEIKVPHVDQSHGGLWPALVALWPSYLGYLISFFTIGIMWVNHHVIFQYVRKCDRRFLFANVFFLMGIAFAPFPTAVLAEHLPHPETRQAAVAFYNGFYVLMAVLFNVVWHFGIGRGGRLLGKHLDQQGLDAITSRYWIGPTTYGIATLAAFASGWVSLAMSFGLAVYWMLSERVEE